MSINNTSRLIKEGVSKMSTCHIINGGQLNSKSKKIIISNEGSFVWAISVFKITL